MIVNIRKNDLLLNTSTGDVGIVTASQVAYEFVSLGSFLVNKDGIITSTNREKIPVEIGVDVLWHSGLESIVILPDTENFKLINTSDTRVNYG